MHYSFFIGSGLFAIVERGVYNSTPIVLKKLHDDTSSDIKKIFAKEAEILAKFALENIVSMLSVCDKPVSILMKLYEFNFIPFFGTEVVNSLDKLLVLMSEENYFTCFPRIGNVIARDITNAIMVLSYYYLAPVRKALLQAHRDRCCSLVKILCIYFCYFDLLNHG